MSSDLKAPRTQCYGKVTVRVVGTKPPTTFERRCTRFTKDGATYCHQHRNWRPGDRCAACGSNDTYWSGTTGAGCRGCGATDADE